MRLHVLVGLALVTLSLFAAASCGDNAEDGASPELGPDATTPDATTTDAAAQPELDAEPSDGSTSDGGDAGDAGDADAADADAGIPDAEPYRADAGSPSCSGVDDRPGYCISYTLATPRLCLAQDLTGAEANHQAFVVTDADQPFVVPNGVTTIRVKLWGAGGGTSFSAQAPSGAGGFATAKLTVVPGEELTVIVGGRGRNYFASGVRAYGGGGVGALFAGNGGGRSAVRRGMTELVTAGGGGGGGACGGTALTPDCPAVGGTGGSPATKGGDPNPAPSDTSYGVGGGAGTLVCGGNGGYTTVGCGEAGGKNGNYNDGSGTAGAPFLGGSSIAAAQGQGGGGGGGGWFGGGSGGGDNSGNMGGGGGGGSSLTPSTGCVLNGNGVNAPNTTDADYVAGIAAGTAASSGDGGGGLVVIYY